jgi:hypothetical protein
VQSNGAAGDRLTAADAPGQVIDDVGRFGSYSCSALLFAHDSGCLNIKLGTYQSEGVVVVLAEQACPIVISAVFLRVRLIGVNLLRHQ